MKDYKDYIEGKYPEPEDRRKPKDFPSLDELYTYGYDFAMPESFDELRCQYNEDERNSLVLADLSGYKVPPLGLGLVAKHGGGNMRGFIYPPGTFRENKSTIGKELGFTAIELTDMREQARRDNVVNAMANLFEEKGLATFDVIKDKDPQLIAAAMSWAFEKIDQSDNPKEALNFVKYMWDKLGSKDTVGDREGKVVDLATTSMKTIDAALVALTKIIEEKQGEVITTVPFDVTGDPDSDT